MPGSGSELFSAFCGSDWKNHRSCNTVHRLISGAEGKQDTTFCKDFESAKVLRHYLHLPSHFYTLLVDPRNLSTCIIPTTTVITHQVIRISRRRLQVWLHNTNYLLFKFNLTLICNNMQITTVYHHLHLLEHLHIHPQVLVLLPKAQRMKKESEGKLQVHHLYPDAGMVRFGP